MEGEPMESVAIHAKQRASVKWLLSKAFNNRVPENLKEPFYRDHEGQDHLKPQIVVELGNATLYCQALSNLYSDPNYQSLNHCSILHTLSRKGVPLNDLNNGQLTETVLIQTNPLRVGAHMSVIEALMVLYAKEIASKDRVSGVISRISPGGLPGNIEGYESALIYWVSHAASALKRRIDVEIERGATDENGVRYQSPHLPPLRDYKDLCDGVFIAFLVAQYCPKVMSWTDVRVNHLPSVEDSIHNILLVMNFSQKHLPYSVFHMTPEDICYMRGSMRTNLIVLLADLFNLFEIHPAKCVTYSGHETPVGKMLTMQSPQGPPRATPPRDSFSLADSSSTSMSVVDPQSPHEDNGFVVHRGRGVPTLASIHQNQNVRMAWEKEERGDSTIPAGRPSDRSERRPSYAGRRSRRNSLTEDSQLTIENFGGSQDHLNLVGRLEKERERKTSFSTVEPAVAIRSSLQDARSSLQIGYDGDWDQSEKQDRDTEKSVDVATNRREPSHNNMSNFRADDHLNASYATLPNTTTWQQQSQNLQRQDYSELMGTDDHRSDLDATKLSSVRLKLEEKRRQIEMEKRKLELALSRQQQKVGQAAFLHTINKESPVSLDSKRLADSEAMDLEHYQRIITNMNVSLNDIQADIQRLAQQQSHNQAQQMHAQQLMQAQQIANLLHQFGSQQNLSTFPGIDYQHRSSMQHRPNNFGSTPHLSQPQNYLSDINYTTSPQSANMLLDERVRYEQTHSSLAAKSNHGFKHEEVLGHKFDNHRPGPLANEHYDYSASTDTGYQSSGPLHKNFLSRDNIHNSAQQVFYDTGLKNEPQNFVAPQQFYLHDQNTSTGSPPVAPQRRTWAQSAALQQYGKIEGGWPNSAEEKTKGTGFMLHPNNNTNGNPSEPGIATHKFSPQHIFGNRPSTQTMEKSVVNNGKQQQQPMKSSEFDEMAPQSISFIGDQDSVHLPATNTVTQRVLPPFQMSNATSAAQDPLETSLNKLNISSGSRTYRIPSPTRPVMNAQSFQDPNSSVGGDEENSGKGFYISFDNETPKRPKPPLRMKRSPKKDVCGIDQPPSAKISESQLQDTVDTKQQFVGSESSSAPFSKNTNININTQDIGYSQSPPVQSRKHLEDVTNYEPQIMHTITGYNCSPGPNAFQMDLGSGDGEGTTKPIIIGEVTVNPDTAEEMERKKERIMLMSLQRRQQQEEAKAVKEANIMRRREKEQLKEEEKMRKKEEQAARRQAILDAHKLKKAIEEAEREGKTIDKADLMMLKQTQQQLQINSSTVRRPQRTIRPRPKTIHVESGSVDIGDSTGASSNRNKKGSNSNLAGIGRTLSSTSIKRDYYRGSQDSLTIKESPDEYCSNSSSQLDRRGSYKITRDGPSPPTMERGRTLSRISVPKGAANFRGRKSNSLMNLCDSDSGLGRATPPRRAPSPGLSQAVGRHLPSPSGPGSLPPGLITKRRTFDDGSSDLSSAQSSMMDYSGPKLYKQPAAKSNRSIIHNAVEYCVFPGVVNREAKQRVLEKMARSEAKHFLILFRDAGCQFRALYSYNPETEQVLKLYGTGPSQVDEYMFDKFFKYNSGGKCFSQIHTKHLTVTIDAFTIHNSLWQGKKVPNLPSKKDMTLVI